MNEELAIFKKMQQGDVYALEFFFQQYKELLYYRALGIIRDSLVVEDIVQDVYIRFWENRLKFDISTSVPGYLIRAVENACKDHLDHQLVHQRFMEYSREDYRNELLPEWDTEEVEMLRKRLREFIQSLPDKCREIFVMACVEGVKYREISEKLDISVNTVKTQVKYAYSKLRSEFSSKDQCIILFLISMSSRSIG